MKHYKVIWRASWFSEQTSSTIITADSKEQVKRLFREAYDVIPRSIKELEVKP